ncbi:tetratricopeptide repeat protein [uncultured Alistipes sp.]|jgi:tetratricopeptide (TPR) repeat protein|uniref:tetratricopeptide repeat protein n=1 Tax=Alistipes sp. TaxID=1872444 RepID=UPI0025F2D6E5|nr:tetratricopeptide repeat protein [uncultured Alistipes sp.]
MKKIVLTALAALLVAIPAVQAQKVNKGALLSKIEKSDADIADAKKSAKSATWINRGKAFYEAAVEPTKNLFANMDAAMLKLAVGEPSSTGQQTLVGTDYEAWVYPYFTAYIKDGKVATWKQTDWVLKDAPAKAIEAYAKAFEMDPKSESKVKEGLKQISDFCSQAGNTGIDTGEYAAAADAYAEAFKAQSIPAYGTPDPALLYYAGYLRTVDGSTNPASFALGADYLTKALDLNYVDEEGNIYYYLFHCYYGQKDADKANIMKAKDALIAGIGKFPKNERILEALVQLYTSPEDQVGDPADLIALIDAAIENNPENIDLWFGRGRIFYALKNYDESIDSFRKVVELKPDLFEGNYYLGVFYTIKADEMNKVMNEKQYSSQAAYDADLKAANEVYMQAIPWFEKAYELKSDDFNTLDMLKQLCFRLRDEPGVQEKYDKYFPLWKAAKGE